MEAVEEVVVEPLGQSKDLSAVAKGKRTKRQRPLSPISFTITPSPLYAGDIAAAVQHHSPTFYAASSEESTTTEEVNTARCLILLSKGHHFSSNENCYNEAATTSNGGATKVAGGGACMYTCKTCNRSFPSFQALGGHRTSHKKPKNEKKSAIYSHEEDFPSPSNRISPTSLSLQLSGVSTTSFSATMKSSPSPRMHECSICGAEFTSGQALGGHMRKHRGGAAPISRSSNIPPEASINKLGPEEWKKPGNGLSLDLNLPASEYEREKSRKETNQRCCPPLQLLH